MLQPLGFLRNQAIMSFPQKFVFGAVGITSTRGLSGEMTFAVPTQESTMESHELAGTRRNRAPWYRLVDLLRNCRSFH